MFLFSKLCYKIKKPIATFTRKQAKRATAFIIKIYYNVFLLLNVLLALSFKTLSRSKTIKYSGGGTYEHFDLGSLESVLQNIQNDDYYPTFVDKLTHLFFCTCEFHCFADGNKRLAITLSAQFLLLNGYLSVAKNFFEITET